MLSTQNSIITLRPLAARLTAENKAAADAVLTELRKMDESNRDRLFILQVWRKHGQDAADSLARRKAGEYLDPDLSQVLEDQAKKRERGEKEKERSNRPKRGRGGASYYNNDEYGPGPSGAPGYSAHGRGGYSATGRGGYGSGRGGSAGGGKRPGNDNKCHICGDLYLT